MDSAVSNEFLITPELSIVRRIFFGEYNDPVKLMEEFAALTDDVCFSTMKVIFHGVVQIREGMCSQQEGSQRLKVIIEQAEKQKPQLRVICIKKLITVLHKYSSVNDWYKRFCGICIVV